MINCLPVMLTVIPAVSVLRAWLSTMASASQLTSVLDTAAVEGRSGQGLVATVATVMILTNGWPAQCRVIWDASVHEGK